MSRNGEPAIADARTSGAMLCCFMVSDSSEEHVLAGAKRNRLTSALLYWGGLPGAPYAKIVPRYFLCAINRFQRVGIREVSAWADRAATQMSQLAENIDA